jgi:mannose-6-phosphate isomerase-like protein (cupin superfamily)
LTSLEDAVRKVAHLIEDPSDCIVRVRQGQRISGRLGEMLNPIDPKSLHEYRLPANSDVELHFHDVDEYWLFTSGRPHVTLEAPNGVRKEFDLGPGDMVACVRGVAHTLKADHELVYFQFVSVAEGDERQGHLTRR